MPRVTAVIGPIGALQLHAELRAQGVRSIDPDVHFAGSEHAVRERPRVRGRRHLRARFRFAGRLRAFRRVRDQRRSRSRVQPDRGQKRALERHDAYRLDGLRPRPRDLLRHGLEPDPGPADLSTTRIFKFRTCPTAVFREDAALYAYLPWKWAGQAPKGTVGIGWTYVGRRALPYDQLSDVISTVDASATLAWKGWSATLAVRRICSTRSIV